MDGLKKVGAMNAIERVLFWIFFVGAMAVGVIALLCNVRTLLVVSFGIWALTALVILTGAPYSGPLAVVCGTSFGIGLLGIIYKTWPRGCAK